MIKSQIIKLNASNLNEIQNILQESFGNEAWTKDQILSSLNNDSTVFYGLYQNNILISLVSVIITLDDINILDICTANKHKNMGYASKLIEHIKSIKQNNQTISLEVKRTNQIAINFYKKHGFKIIAERKKYYRDGEDALIMFFDYNH